MVKEERLAVEEIMCWRFKHKPDIKGIQTFMWNILQ